MTARTTTAFLLAMLAGFFGRPMPAAAGDDARCEAVLRLDARDLLTVVHLEDAFDDEVRGSLEHGLPITLRVTAELWRARSSWFDKQLASRVRTYRLRWDPGERRYLVATGGRRAWVESFETLDAALEQLSGRSVPLERRSRLAERHAYFAIVEVAIQHLTLDEVHELDGWVRGRLGGGSAPPDAPPDGPEVDDGGGGLSGAFFDLLVSWAGVGDRIFRARTPAVHPSQIEPVSAAPESVPEPTP